MNRNSGFTLIELIIAVAVAGILMGVGVVALRPARFAVNQAAQTVASAIMQARFEAIKANRTAQITVSTAGSGFYEICVDENDDGTCAAGEVVDRLDFGVDDYGQVALSATTLDNSRVRFDRRGIPTEGVSGRTVTLSQRSGTHQRVVVLNSTGRAEVQ